MMVQSSSLRLKLQPYLTLKNVLVLLIVFNAIRYVISYLDDPTHRELDNMDMNVSIIVALHFLGLYGVYKCHRPLVCCYLVFSVGLIISSIVRYSGMFRPPRYSSGIINVGLQILVFGALLSYVLLRMPEVGDCADAEDPIPYTKEKPKETA